MGAPLQKGERLSVRANAFPFPTLLSREVVSEPHPDNRSLLEMQAHLDHDV